MIDQSMPIQKLFQPSCTCLNLHIISKLKMNTLKSVCPLISIAFCCMSRRETGLLVAFCSSIHWIKSLSRAWFFTFLPAPTNRFGLRPKLKQMELGPATMLLRHVPFLFYRQYCNMFFLTGVTVKGTLRQFLSSCYSIRTLIYKNQEEKTKKIHQT